MKKNLKNFEEQINTNELLLPGFLPYHNFEKALELGQDQCLEKLKEEIREEIGEEIMGIFGQILKESGRG
jgi:hypothetical protein